MTSRQRTPFKHQHNVLAGFTLIELVIVMALLAILAKLAIPRAFNTSVVTLDSQIRTLASDLQRAQLLASTSGQIVLFCTISNAYLLQKGGTCPDANNWPGQTSATQPVLVSFDNNVTFQGTQPALSFNSTGQPNGAASFTIQATNTPASTKTASVKALTGMVSVLP